MAAAKFDDILKDLNYGKFAPMYYFYGEEEYFIDQLVDTLESKVLAEHEKAFNLHIVYGKDCSFQQLMELSRRLPMGADRQLVIMKEAQSFQLKSDDEQVEKLLQHYTKNPQKSTILAFAHKHGSPDKRKKIYKMLLDNSVSMEAKPLYENQIPEWTKSYLKSKGYSMNEDALRLFVDFVGSELSVLANEIDKLIIGAGEKKTIDVKQIENSVGLIREFSVFELSNVIAARQTSKAYRIVNYFKNNPKSGPLVLVLGTLHNFFTKVFISATHKNEADAVLASILKVNPFFVKDYKLAARNFSLHQIELIFSIIGEYDLRSKGVNNHQTSESELMREMIFRILNC
jgi:DNA polymerase-3 subunit delta